MTTRSAAKARLQISSNRYSSRSWPARLPGVIVASFTSVPHAQAWRISAKPVEVSDRSRPVICSGIVVERERVLAGADVVRLEEDLARGDDRPRAGDGLDVEDGRGGHDLVPVLAGRGGDGLGADDGDDEVVLAGLVDELLLDEGQPVGGDGDGQFCGDLDGHDVCSFRYSSR